MIQTRVPIFLKSPHSLDDKIRTTVQLITYTVPQNCLSLFTIHHNSHPKLSVLAQRLSFRFFFLEGRHLSKIRLGTNVTRKIYLSFVWSRVLFLSSFTAVVDLSKSMTCCTFTPSFIPNISFQNVPYKSITLNHSLSNLIISSQRLLTMSVSLRTQSGLHCLIIQVLNTTSLLPKCLTQFCT